MSELDKLLDAVMRQKQDVIEAEADPSERQELIDALREKKKDDIVKEIRNEYKQELKEEIISEMQDERNRKKIEDLKELIVTSLVMAFLVGLAVNQVTDIISYFKNGDTGISLGWTVLCTIILFAISVLLYIQFFIKKAMDIINNSIKKE